MSFTARPAPFPKFVVSLLAALAPLASPAQNAPAATLARVEAPAAGLYRVRLQGTLLSRHEGGWTVRDTAGRPVPHHLLMSAPGGERPVQVVDLSESAEGWTITLDVGEPFAAHDRVRLRPSAPVLASRCALEFGDAPDRLTPGGEGRIFSLGRSGNLQKAELSYAPTTKRFVRVHWPRAAGFPQFENATVDGPPFDAGEWFEPLAPGPGEPFPGGRAWTIPPGAPLVHARGLLLGAGGCGGWRVRAARGGAWRPLGHGVCGGIARVPLGDYASGDALRIELFGEVTEIRSLSAAWPVVELWLLAPAPGGYLLTPRESLRSDYPLPAEALGRVPAADLKPELPAPAPTDGDLAAFAPLPDRLGWNPEKRWTVRAEAGRWSELPLPLEAQEGGHFLLIADGRAVPSESRTLPLPVLETEATDAAPRQPDGRNLVTLPVRLPGRAAPPFSVPPRCGVIELTVPAADFGREVTLVREENHRAGLEEKPPIEARSEWSCTANDGVCALELRACPGPETTALRIEITGRNQPPLPPLRVAAWRPVSVLRFLAPAGPLTLGWDPAREVGDFPAFAGARARLAGRDAAPATIEGAAMLRSPGTARLQRAVLLAGLVVAGALLLYVVASLLPAREKQDP